LLGREQWMKICGPVTEKGLSGIGTSNEMEEIYRVFQKALNGIPNIV
jgi:hypothetical protein